MRGLSQSNGEFLSQPAYEKEACGVLNIAQVALSQYGLQITAENLPPSVRFLCATAWQSTIRSQRACCLEDRYLEDHPVVFVTLVRNSLIRVFSHLHTCSICSFSDHLLSKLK